MITRNCNKHGDYQAELVNVTGKERYSLCPQCFSDHQAVYNAALKEENQRILYSLLKAAGIPDRFWNDSFKTYIPVNSDAEKNLKKITSYCENFDKVIEAGSGLVICGLPGTGKSHLASSITKELIRNNHRAYYITAFKMLSQIKATYDREEAIETEIQAIKRFTSYMPLIIDEIGIQRNSKEDKILFFQIIDGRYEKKMPTILVSNLNTKHLEDFIGSRCFDRLNEGAGVTLSFDWESYR